MIITYYDNTYYNYFIHIIITYNIILKVPARKRARLPARKKSYRVRPRFQGADRNINILQQTITK